MPNNTRSSAKPSAAGGSKNHDGASSTQANANTPPGMANAPNVPGEVATELAKLAALIVETSESHDKKLEEIRTTTSAMENKLAEIVNRISTVESRLGFLEDANEKLEANPPASCVEVDTLRQKLDDVENRERRHNLRFVGFPEGCEKDDAVSFLEELIPTLFEIAFPKGLEIENAHRLGVLPRRHDGERSPRPRAIIARFLRFQDRNRITEAARKKENIVWNGCRIMVFADYSKLLNDKRGKFNECKKLLHDKRIRFSLNYPAVLLVKTAQGSQRFDDHKKALSFIRSLD